MKNGIMVFLTILLFLTSTAFGGGKSEYEINQPLGVVLVKMSVPGVKEIIMEHSGAELISKKLCVVELIWTKEGFKYSTTFDIVAKRRGDLMTFREVFILNKDGVVSTTELIDSEGRIDKYLLVTTLKKIGDKTLVHHEIDMEVDGADHGIRVVIAQRLALSKAESGVRHVLGEPRPDEK